MIILIDDDNRTPLIINEDNGRYSKDKYLTTDLRPVFAAERALLRYLLDDSIDSSSIFWKSPKTNSFVYNGKMVNVKIEQLKKLTADKDLCTQIREEALASLENEEFSHFERTIEKNEHRLNELFFEAEDIINNQLAKRFSNIDSEVISFSGGKDSTVVSHVVRRVKGDGSILHIFGDTTLEDPNTYNYIERFMRDNPLIPVVFAETEKDFFELTKTIGPPSRVMRWCCPIFKTGPIDEEFNLLTDSDSVKKLISYIGIRRSESSRRAKYETIVPSPKIEGQIAVHPIINWTDFDVFLYMLKHRLDFNDSYRLGFNRVGCWCCPMNSHWSDNLYKIYFPEEAYRWRDFLVDFAEKAGKSDVDRYVDEKKWASRQGGDGLDNSFSGLEFTMCGDLDNAIRYEPPVELDDYFLVFLKPLGTLSTLVWDSTDRITIDDSKGSTRYIIEKGLDGTLKIVTTRTNRNEAKSELSLFKCQLTKFESCIGCGACFQSCQFGAIDYLEGRYIIDDGKCTKCGRCIKVFEKGCLAAKVTKVKK